MKRRGDAKGGNYAAPWKDVTGFDDHGKVQWGEYLPVSPRTGRAVAQSSAERDWAEGHGYVGSAGLWNHAEELAQGSGLPAATPPRHDEEAMRAFVERKSAELTGHQYEVYLRFWVERRSYGATARIMETSRKSVAKAVLGLRRKLAAISAGGSPQTTGQVQCPKCQAPTRVTRTKHGGGVTRRLRRCLECAHDFATSERPDP